VLEIAGTARGTIVTSEPPLPGEPASRL